MAIRAVRQDARAATTAVAHPQPRGTAPAGCALLWDQAQAATRQTKRALLEALEVQVLVSGGRYRIAGVLGRLGLEGDVTVQPSESSV
jgi:hypothetical protein